MLGSTTQVYSLEGAMTAKNVVSGMILTPEEEEYLRHINRHERRRWVAEQRRKGRARLRGRP